MTEFVGEHLQWAATHAAIWGFLFIFVFMTIESSFIPFPSEVVMIPAGVLVYRCELTFANATLDGTIAIVLAILGSLLGAWINYILALKLGRPFLYTYGKYFFLKPVALKRSEEIFCEYGDMATLVCRLLPAIRQLISIPAGLAKMSPWRFSLFTSIGAGAWSMILLGIGIYIGHLSDGSSYTQMVEEGKTIIKGNMIILIAVLAFVSVAYVMVHKRVMKSKKDETIPC